MNDANPWQADTSPAKTSVPIGISSCLLGERVRFDSGHKNNSYISKTLSEYFDFKPFCPEVSIGMGIPREPIRLVSDQLDGGDIRCVGTKTEDLDVTEKLEQCGQDQLDWARGLCGYIFKKDSPSCGMERVKIYYKNNPKRSGIGLFAKQIIEALPNLPTEEEGRLGDAILRENFIRRVFIYKRWKNLMASQPSKQDLVDFHARHKLIYFSHNQPKTRELGRLVARIGDMTQDDYCEQYIAAVTDIVKKPADKKNNANVLKHIQGYLKRDLDSDDKQELEHMIEQYRLGYLPLIVPITILRHHFRKCPDEYINRSYYMDPHPKELKLLNPL